jgi:peptide/nickel transport system substrate-binding protein
MWRLVLLAVAVTVGLAGAAHAASPQGGTLRVGTEGDIDSADPALAWTTGSWQIEYATCAKLFNYPDAAGAPGTRVVPEVVDTYTESPDRKTYTFDLRKTFRFQNGAPVTAASFAEALNRDANPQMDSPAIAYMHEIVGADDAHSGTSRSIAGVHVLGPYRLQIQLSRPVGDLIARLTDPFFCPLLPNTPIAPAGIDDPAGSGPYYLSSHIANRQIVLKRNPFYRGNRPAGPDQIVWTIGEPKSACFTDVEQNRVDFCGAMPTFTARDLAAKYGINRRNGQFFVSPGLGTNFFAFNHDRPAFKGPGQIPLEKAINYAIDRPALVRAYGYLAGRRTDQMLPPALGRDFSAYPLAGADPKTARTWLARAAYRPSRLVLYASSSPSGVAVAQVFAFDLKEIGIDVDVSYFDIGTEFTKAGTRGEPYDVVFNSWAVDYADPSAFFEPLLDGRTLQPTGNTNLSYLDDPAVDARIDAANKLTGDQRRQAWADLDADLMRSDPPWAPFLQPNDRVLVSASYGCFVDNPVYGVDLAAACMK